MPWFSDCNRTHSEGSSFPKNHFIVQTWNSCCTQVQQKVSYHIIVKTYTEEATKVLLKNFLNCRAVAMMVNEILGTRIQVRCRSAENGLDSDCQYTSFIDIGIYNKDRALRLTFSSKITSSDRPFVPSDYKHQSQLDGLSHEPDDDGQKETENLVKTLVAPPCEKDYTVFEVEYKRAA